MKKLITKQFTAMLLLLIMVFSSIAPGLTAAAAGTVKMSQSSATIQSGETLQLSVLVDGAARSDAAWGSSDTSVATVSQTGLVTGGVAGSAVITAMVEGTSVECLVSVVQQSTGTTTRYNVLIIDTSSSVKGNPLKKEKAAAKRFCSKVLGSAGNNYVAVVTLNSSSSVACGFTNDNSALSTTISGVRAKGGTNINQALKKAGELLDKVPGGKNVMKNVILCSDGLPQTGTKASSGRYKASDHKHYKYANAAYKTDVKLKNKDYFIYALGFFHNSSGNDLIFGKRLMKDLASKGKYYVVTDSKKIDEVFEDIADKITQTTISNKTLTLYVGDTYTLSAQVDGVTRKASWKSSKKSVAAVNSSGKVTAKKKGKTVITATVGGKSVTCTVTVKNKKSTTPKKTTPKASIRLNKTEITIYAGKTYQLKATVTGKSKKVTWTTGNKSIATVSKNGKVKGKTEGTVTVTAKANGKKATCRVNVIVRHPEYSVYVTIPPTKCRYGKVIDEVGDVLKVNEGAVIEKCGAVFQKSGTYTYAIVAFKGTNITSANLVYYFARSGKVLYTDGYRANGVYMSIYPMRKNSDGIWSMYGNYSGDKFNYHDARGRDVALTGFGADTKNVRLFDTKEEMIAWLKE